MEPRNETRITEFFLLGLSEDPELQPLLFGLFLCMYLLTVLGNLLLILAVSSDSHLHTPMYFFLSNLSLSDIGLTSSVVPKMMLNIDTQSNAISYEGCLTQMCLILIFGVLDDLLLTVMAYNRFQAICHPLHYTVVMNPWFCGLLALGCWGFSILHAFLQILLVLRLSFCGDLKIPHIFCDVNEVVRLACSDTFVNEVVVYIVSMFLAGVPISGILYSYSKIVCSICRISSAQGKYKAFSTCASHLTVVSLFYCTSLGGYISSTGPNSSHTSATASVMYSVVTPMLNPFIYSLRNKDITGVLKRFFVTRTAK